MKLKGETAYLYDTENVVRMEYGGSGLIDAGIVGVVDILTRRVPSATMEKLYELAVQAGSYRKFVGKLYSTQRNLLGGVKTIGETGISAEILTKYVYTHSKNDITTIPIFQFPVGTDVRDVVAWIDGYLHD